MAKSVYNNIVVDPVGSKTMHHLRRRMAVTGPSNQVSKQEAKKATALLSVCLDLNPQERQLAQFLTDPHTLSQAQEYHFS